MAKAYKARKAFSIHSTSYAPGDPVPIKDLQRIPNWPKMVRGGFVIEAEDDDE